ncbi:2-(3-amino-3-carboxypropyl)histidine synthase subunit 1 [Plasmodiophora brassicae]
MALNAVRRYTRRAGIEGDRILPAEIRRKLAELVAECLPSNYEFEIEKTVRRCLQDNVRCVALQFPEGLLAYACTIGDLLTTFTSVDDVIVLGDVTYGACCIDDYTAAALQTDLLVHYGHSCLVPISTSRIPCLYVFVDIQIDVNHLVDTVDASFDPSSRICLAGTIQFESAIAAASQALGDRALVPQCRPLSRGEVLGCTAPSLAEGTCDALVFVADGRFHLESMMMANPWLDAYRYDPYGKRLTREAFAHDRLMTARQLAVNEAVHAKSWGIILGTLGRQGNIQILERVESMLKERHLPYTMVLLSEIFPDKLALFADVDAWVQIACPRLSIDWGSAFAKPLLSSYEAVQALSSVRHLRPHPMDYYSKTGGPWANYYADERVQNQAPKPPSAHRAAIAARRAALRRRKATVMIQKD